MKFYSEHNSSAAAHICWVYLCVRAAIKNRPSNNILIILNLASSSLLFGLFRSLSKSFVHSFAINTPSVFDCS